MTPTYSADIGSWERGWHVGLPGATNLKDALAKATELLSKTDDLDENPYVVQIYNGKTIVYHYMNGSI